MLRHLSVCGIQDKVIHRERVVEDKLTLTRATEITLAMEAAAKDASNLKNPVTGEIKYGREGIEEPV